MRRSIWGNSVLVPGAIKSSGTGGIGYMAGAGGAVTQGTGKTTGVTIDKTCGTITLVNTSMNADTIASFAVTNGTGVARDIVLITHDSVGTLGAYSVVANTVATGSFSVAIKNNTAGALGEAIVLRFAVIKAVIA